MRHAVDHRKLGRAPAHRKALIRNLMNALVRSERIETTVARAKELRRLADRLITLGKKDTTHARRRVFALLSDKENTEKIFAGLAGRFGERAGGYTRIVRTDYRVGDGAEMAILEYLPAEEKKAGAKKGRRKKAAPKAQAAKAAGRGKGEAASKAKGTAKAEAEGSTEKGSKGKGTGRKGAPAKDEAR